MTPQFEEKTFEVAANGELRLSSADLYSPGQVAEGILGFDIATFQPHTSTIWNYIQSAAPGGIRLLPNLWPNGNQPSLNVRLPSYVVSLILQYKRAHYLSRANAKQYPLWGPEYYRFGVDADQQSVLLRLEGALAGNAVLRYAAPAFHLYDDLENYTRDSQVLSHTNYVSPNALTNHEAWTYTDAGAAGWANAEPEKIRAESWRDVTEIVSGSRRPTTVLAHLREMATSLLNSGLAAEVTLPLNISIPSEVTSDPALRRGLQDLLIIGRAIGRFGASWWLEVLAMGPPGQEVQADV